MVRWSGGLKFLFLLAAIGFIYTQVRLFKAQSEYAEKVAAAVEGENHCTSQMQLLISQISMQKERLVGLEEIVQRKEEECEQLRTLVQNLERKGVKSLFEQVQVPVAAVVIMACNRADYLERTIKSILKDNQESHEHIRKRLENINISKKGDEEHWILRGSIDQCDPFGPRLHWQQCVSQKYVETILALTTPLTVIPLTLGGLSETFCTLRYHGSVASKFPVFVSQDGSNSDVRTKALSYKQLTYMQHLDYEPVQTERPGELIAYYKIARHYKWALDQLFYKHNFNRVVILEDDMEISPDFFSYFEAGADLLDKDKSIMAISSWNDNGQKQFVHDPYTLYRSDFFPGLGWMLSKPTWDELSPKWPKAYWDDWLRLQENHKGRQFIRPEVCRTYNFGEHGSSLGQFFNQYLKPIRLIDLPIDWKSMNLTYLMKDNFVHHFANLVKGAHPIYGTDFVLKINNIDGDVRIQYRDQAHFEEIARQFGIFEEWKDGIPRTAYKGVVVFRYKSNKQVFLVGLDSLEQLGIQNN